MTAETNADHRLSRIERSLDDLIQTIEGLPAEMLYREPAAGEWPVMSTLAHLQELLPYWAHQAANIAAAPGQPFGRAHDDPDRIGAVATHGGDSLQAILPRLRASLAECLATLRGIPPDAWQQTGQHPRRGSMSVADVVDAFLVDHAVEHANQIDATLRALHVTR